VLFFCLTPKEHHRMFKKFPIFVQKFEENF